MADGKRIFTWLQDNARILLSVLLVLFLLFAVYSYSQRSQLDASSSLEDDTVELSSAVDGDGSLDPSVYGGTDAGAENGESEGGIIVTDTEASDTANGVGGDNLSPTAEGTVEVKGEMIEASAELGDGLTHLARRAAASYTGTNGISLSPAEKIYVETKLVQNLGQHTEIYPGTKVSFDSQMIASAITGAQNMRPALRAYFEECTVNVAF